MNIIVKGIRYIANIGDCYKTLSLLASQDELVDRLLSTKDKIFLKH
jgi:hypothetical protein